MIKTINVTAKHIQNGKRNNRGHCPVALALKEIISSNYIIEVLEKSIDIFSIYPVNGNYYDSSIDLPDDAINFIKEYDADHPIYKPFSFDLEIPEPYLGV